MTDMLGNELNVGDNICFTLRADWRQTPPLVSARVIGFKCGAMDWVYVDNYRNLPTNAIPLTKVVASRVIKCY